MKRALILGAVLALLVVPLANAAGLTWNVVSGTAGDNGWWRSPVKIQITASDPPCPAVGTVIPFNTSSDEVTCTAGGSTFKIQFNIDPDPPTVTGAAPSRPADKNGWYTQPVTVTFSGSDSNSGLASCTTGQYAGPDTASGNVSGTCKDKAGNVSAASSFPLKYDATPPTVSPSTARPPDSNGWFNKPVAVSFSGSDATSGNASCTGGTTYSGPDTGGTSISGSCTDNAGNSASGSLSLKYDATPPTISYALARSPDDNGFYTHPVAVTFDGKDAGSGLASCTPATTYSGPDNDAATVTGTCTDNAGNTTSVAVPFKYDSTPPKLKDVAVAVAGDAATVSWKHPADTASVAVQRSPGRDGAKSSTVYTGKGTSIRDAGLKAGVVYRYTLVSRDQAGNQAQTSVAARVLALYAPRPGATVKPGARLAWITVRGVQYYNVQLFLRGHKVLTAWPVTASFTLPKTWTYEGKPHRLVRGVYRWYVWPGKGARAKGQYGRLIGGSTFRVR